jgi:hypothetical protein
MKDLMMARRYTVLVAMAMVIQTDGSLLAQTPDAIALKGTTWFCAAQIGDGKTRKGYMYLSPTMGVKLAETERSPNADGEWWPPIKNVSKDLDDIEPNMRWDATRNQVRIYYHPDRSMYVAARAPGKMWMGAVPLEQADPETFFQEAVCQGLVISRAGACPALFDYRIDDPTDKFMMCEQRPTWPR